MSMGNRISEIRKAKGYTQEYIAEQLGISRQAVYKWEKGSSAPDTKNLIALAELLGVSVEYLATGAEAASEQPKQTVVLPFRKLSRGFFGAGVLLYLFGIANGQFNRMVMVPVSSNGNKIGIPFLYYGTSEWAKGLLMVVALLLFGAFLFHAMSSLDTNHK